MSWNPFWWSLPAALHEHDQPLPERLIIDDPGYDPGAWERVRGKLSARLEPKREVTVVRSTRAMPERKR